MCMKIPVFYAGLLISWVLAPIVASSAGSALTLIFPWPFAFLAIINSVHNFYVQTNEPTTRRLCSLAILLCGSWIPREG